MYGNDGAMAAKAYAESGNQMAARETEINIEVRRLAETAHQLQDVAISLCSRLTQVQRPGVGAGIEKPPSPQPVLCPLAGELRNIRELMESVGMLLDANRGLLEI